MKMQRKREATSRLYEKYKDYLTTIIRSKLNNKNEEDVKDCLHDVFIVIFLKYPEEELEYEKAWITKIATNVVMTFNEKERRRGSFFERLLLEQETENWEETIENRVIDRLILERAKENGVMDRLRNQLSEQDKVLYYLKYELDLSNKEIAAKLHIKENTVSVRLKRLKQKIQKYVKKYFK